MLRFPVLLLALALAGEGPAQTLSYRSFGLDRGLPSSEAHCLARDAEGYLWVGTDRGVARFDGQRFRAFGPEAGLADDVVLDLHVAPDGRLWASHLRPALSVREEEGTFRSLPLPGTDLLPEGQVTHTYAKQLRGGPGDTLWMALRNGPVLGLAPDGGRRVLPSPGGAGLEVTTHRVGDGVLAALRDHPLTAPVAVVAESRPDGTWRVRPGRVDRRFFQGHAIPAALPDGTLLLAVQDLLLRLGPVGVADSVRLPQILSLLVDAGGGVWIGTRQGLWRWDRPSAEGRPRPVLPGPAVTDLLLDPEGSLWFSTLDRGLCQVPDPALALAPGPMPDRRVTCLLAEADTLWAGSYAGWRYGWPLDGEGFPRGAPSAVHEGQRSDLKQLMRDARGRLWSSFLPDAVYGRMVEEQPASVHPGGAFVAPLPGGAALHVYQRVVRVRDGRLEAVLGTVSGDGRLVNVLDVLPGGDTVWLGTEDGLRAATAGRLWRPPGALEGVKVAGIDRLPGGGLLLATRGRGLLVWKDGEARAVFARALPASLNDALVWSDTLWWAAGQEGVYALPVRDGRPSGPVRRLDRRRGLPSDEVSRLERSGERLWVATKEGLAGLAVGGWRPNALAPPVHLSGVRLAGRDTVLAAIGTLPWRHGDLSLRFDGLAYRQATRPRFRYRFAGRDTAWTEFHQRELTLTGLPPGRHRLEVAAANEDGVWSRDPVRLHLRVRRPWWGSTGLRAAGALLLLAVPLAWNRYRLRRIRYEQALMEARLKSLGAQLNPHFLFNALNGVQQFLVGNEPLEAQRYLARFARLMRSVLGQMRAERVRLSLELRALEDYLHLENLRLDGGLSWSLELDDGLDPERVHVPGLMLQPLLENAIRWGIAHRDDRRGRLRVRVGLSAEGRSLRVLVEDNGIGRARAEALPPEERRRSSNGAGLGLVRKRLSLWSRRTGRPLHLRMRDARPGHPRHPGTVVEFEWPVLDPPRDGD